MIKLLVKGNISSILLSYQNIKPSKRSVHWNPGSVCWESCIQPETDVEMHFQEEFFAQIV